MTSPEPSESLTVELKGWKALEALAIVDGVPVWVRRKHQAGKSWVDWRCRQCGKQRNAPTCPHARAFAALPLPAPLEETAP